MGTARADREDGWKECLTIRFEPLKNLIHPGQDQGSLFMVYRIGEMLFFFG